jgi:ketosteroid isomerase-like protein
MPTDNPIHRFLATYRTAVLARDIDAFVALYADDIQVFDLWGTWRHDGIAGWRAMAEGWFGSHPGDRFIVEFSEVHDEVGSDLATVHAFAKFSGVAADGTVLRSLENRFSATLRRQGSAWKVFHQHTSVPVAMQSGKPIFQR